MTHREFEGWDEYDRRLKAASMAGSPDWAAYPQTKRVMRLVDGNMFFTGTPCLRGHVSPRNVHGVCTQCYVLMLKEMRNA